MGWTRNNLILASSPYLRQHAGNPIWWQEWNQDVLDHARRENKLLFVSVGYATCHWCHVMASESFQDPEVALYLNNNFVSIKVDREQRPDIDQYLMAFITATGRQGGWPLNCFMTPDLNPFFAMTYAPLRPRLGMPGFIDILKAVKGQYSRFSGHVQPFTPPMTSRTSLVDTEPDFRGEFHEAFDDVYGGFGERAKFPPHCSLLFMLYYLASHDDANVRHMVERTLDRMLQGGLHDHLQGGFFRYCVDREWIIPHFEKMLYDQAMMLWVYSLAYGLLGKDAYRQVVRKLILCLEDTFEENGLYVAGHDADTGHQEGASYLWSREELQQVLGAGEYERFGQIYRITEHGNFEGRNHLVRDQQASLDAIEQKLLAVRRLRRQPLVDRKIITSWNSLVGIGLIHAYRYAGEVGALARAEAIVGALLKRHTLEGVLVHSSFEGEPQRQGFLQDYAAFMLLLTYIFEENGHFGAEMREHGRKIRVFWQMKGWIESYSDDFFPVFASDFDHPIPSSVSLAEMALLRKDILEGREYSNRPYRRTLENDFYNLTGLAANGYFHIMESPAPLEWRNLPVNIIQVRGERVRDCFQGACHDFVLTARTL